MSNGRTPLFLSAIVLLMLSGLVISHQPDSSFEPAAHVLALERDGRITLRASDARLLDVARELGRVTGVDIQLDDRLDDVRVDLNLMDASFESVLKSISGSHAQILEKRDDDYAVASVLITAEVDEVHVEPAVVEDQKPITSRLPAGVLSNTDEPRHRVMARDRNVILLQNAIIDTDIAAQTGGSVEVPDAFRAREDTEFHIVQFAGRIGAQQREALEGAGAVISHYVPNSALAIRIHADQLDTVRSMADVRHVEPYHPYYKMSDDLLAYKSETATQEQIERARLGSYSVVMFGGTDADEFVPPPSGQEVHVRAVGQRHIVTIDCDPDHLTDLLVQDVVQWVEPNIEPMPMNDLAAERVRASSARARVPGLDGSGVIVAVTDTGLDYLNPGFAVDPDQPVTLTENTRIVHYAVRQSSLEGSTGEPGDVNGHGTHVAGTIFGNGALSETAISAPGSYRPFQFQGMAPAARGVIIDDFRSFSNQEQAEVAYTHGARISNNSWGAAIFSYSARSMEWDYLVRDALANVQGNQEFTVIFSAGNSGQGNNDGTGGVPGTIGSPGNAKNVISVGAVEQPRRADNWANATVETDSDWQVTAFSSRGPVTTMDLRTKPDIVAPGAYVLSVQSRETMPDDLSISELPGRDYRAGNVNTGTNWAFFSGTSMSGPVVAGGAALFYEFYEQRFGEPPSPAMTKAALVGGARMLNSLVYNYPNQPWNLERSDQGWGMMDISRSMLGSSMGSFSQVIMLDQNQVSPVRTEDSFTTEVTLGAGEGNMRVVLAWTDAPGTPGNARQLVNDIDLVVHAPRGGGYLGNFFGRDRIHSEYFDTIDLALGDYFNNVEIVSLKDAEPGTYTIEVYGWEVNDGPQDFALFIMTGTGIEGSMRGETPTIDLDDQNAPVMAYTARDLQGFEQVYVRRWVGETGDLSQLDEWARMEDQWVSIGNSAVHTGISYSQEPSRNPDVAVHGDHIYVVWEHHGIDGRTRIYMRYYDGTDWRELGTSAQGDGIASGTVRPVRAPEVVVNGTGEPVVKWMQSHPEGGMKVHVARWNAGRNRWEGYGNSMTEGVGDVFRARNGAITINSAGHPVIVYQQLIGDNSANDLRLRVFEWDGERWRSRGTLGNDIIADRPAIAAGRNRELYVAWLQRPDNIDNLRQQVYARRWTGSQWMDMAGSSTGLGLSGSESVATTPSSVAISYTHSPSRRVTVSWVAGYGEGNSVLVKEYDFNSWSGVRGAGEVPGVGATVGINSAATMTSHSDGVPVVAMQTDDDSGSQIRVYTLVRNTTPPQFGGLRSARGGTNNNVRLRWDPATDQFATSIVYRVYQSPHSVPCWETAVCDQSAVFADANVIATLTNETEFVALGLTDYHVYCFGVRADDGHGNMDNNTVTMSAGPLPPGRDCLEEDTDGDGIPDWWEVLYFGNPTGAVANASNEWAGVNTLTFLEAYQHGTDPFAIDSDGDGISDWDEVHGWVNAAGDVVTTDPSRADTADSDMPDGLAADLEFDPRRWDTHGTGISDGKRLELGWDHTDVTPSYHILFEDDFEPGSLTREDWELTSPSPNLPWNFWHLSLAEPAPKADPNILRQNDRTATTAYRMAIDEPFGTNVNATYSQGTPLLAALVTPPNVIDATGVSNLYVEWREFYETEPVHDQIYVQARSDDHPGWITVSLPRSGWRTENKWAANKADLTRFAGHSNVRIRFVFQANAVNNHFAGWYVDDVRVYSGAEIHGWVRDINGRAVVGAQVSALGAGGVARVQNGHQVVDPGMVIGQATTAADGSYSLVGLPLGEYVVKAEASFYRGEFFNGELFDPVLGYVFGAGIGFNPGVPNVEDVNGGRLDLSAPNARVTNVFFELERGEYRTHIGVARSNAPASRVEINFASAMVWNGDADPNTATRVPYWSTNVLDIVDPRPDWIDEPVQPAFYGEAQPGRHRVTLDDDSLWYVPPVRIESRQGEYNRVNVRTADVSVMADGTPATSVLGRGFLAVSAQDGGNHPIYLNGRPTGHTTPALLLVQAGSHWVQLRPDGRRDITPRAVDVPIGRRTSVSFAVEQIQGDTGGVRIHVRDAAGNELADTTIQVFLNGIAIDEGPFDASPIVLDALQVGAHYVSIRAEGFRDSEIRPMDIRADAIGSAFFPLFQSDEDYDGVGDHSELISYGDIFRYDRTDDPVGDGLTTLQQFNLFRDFGITLDLFEEDTDEDGMTDRDELSYSGFLTAGEVGSGGYMNHPDHLMYALSTLATNAVQDTDTVRAKFVGRFLDGISNFEQPADRRYTVSIRGDRFVATNMNHVAPVVPNRTFVETVFTGIRPEVDATWTKAVRQGHPPSAPIFADTRPDVLDTVGDGIWDGYAFKYKYMIVTQGVSGIVITNRILDPIELGRQHDDPDHDGLSNLQEFQYGLSVGRPLDMDPRNPDTDGDGMPDGWEVYYGLDPLDPTDAFDDLSGDGLINLLEYRYGTNPRIQDTDGDGLTDYEEITGIRNPWKEDAFLPEFPGSTDPLNPDTDGDGLLDGFEIEIGTNPNRWDTSGDGMSDGFCVLDPYGNLLPRDQWLDPLDPEEGGRDYSGDGMSNLENFLVRDGLGNFGRPPEGVVWDFWLDPRSADSDGDGMPDVFEVYHGLHPFDPIETKEGVTITRYPSLGAGGDPDADGLWNLREYEIRFHLDPNADPFVMPGLSTDPWNPDTDGDGLFDGEEDRAFRSDPTRQDTDRDGLFDGSGIPGTIGEVESTFRDSLYEVVEVPGGMTWAEAADFASSGSFMHPYHPGVRGQLAVIRNPEQQMRVDDLIAGTPGVQFAALGGRADGMMFVNWVNNQFVLFVPPYAYALGEPQVSDGGGVGIDASLPPGENWIARADGFQFDHIVVEYAYHPVETNHYDLALNDLWQLVWPGLEDLPHWRRIEVDADSPLPPPRWGHAASYVPVFVTKLPRNRTPDSDSRTITLMDNRQLVVLGGRDGVTKYGDVWEFRIRDNQWHRSVEPLYGEQALFLDARSEFQAITKFAYRNTKATACPCEDVPYNCDGEEFGEPKNRPWSNARSMDWTYLHGGWDNNYAYMQGHSYYKSTDDDRPITETRRVNRDVVQFDAITDLDGALPVFETVVEDFVERQGMELLPIGSYIAESFFTGSNDPERFTNNNVWVGWNFSELNMRLRCETIVGGQLTVRVQSAPASDLTVYYFAELNAQRQSPDDYDAADPFGRLTRRPSVRRTSEGWTFNSRTNTFIIPAGSSADIELDITEMLEDVVAFSPNLDTLGFVVYTEQPAMGSTAYLRNLGVDLTISYVPSYKISPEWRFPTCLTFIRYVERQALSARKSHAMVYNYDRDRVFLFGGIDGNRVMGDTHEGQLNIAANPRGITWRTIVSQQNPPARWGHSMVYDARNNRMVLFGGFDAQHKPLNDLWVYEFADDPPPDDEDDENGEGGEVEVACGIPFAPGQWRQIVSYTSTDRPQPRGGASMIYYGDYDWDRGLDEYSLLANKRQIILFGGTDGEQYFNDTWVYDGNRWILANPTGQLSQAPPPRAFASFDWAQNARVLPDPDGAAEYRENVPPPNGPGARPAALLFGGRTGTLPTGRDTDRDLVDDGVEHSIGGPEAGRDPRVSAIVNYDPDVGPLDPPDETLPFNFVPIGPVYRFGPVFGPGVALRGLVADMESLRHDDGGRHTTRGFPWEIWPDADANRFFGPRPLPQKGVETKIPEQSMLWYSRHGTGNFDDPRNVWQLGVPDASAAGPGAVPPWAYSGRWVFGTQLNGNYPNNAKMELYSPIFDLTIPADVSPYPDNFNAFHLIFHEWLQLADANDTVKIELIRPSTPADINNRVTGTGKATPIVLGARNNAFNTTGEWRRVVVPLEIAGNEENLFLRFTLETDAVGTAGGWYIDDVALIQGADLEGTYPALGDGSTVELLGARDGVLIASSVSYGNGRFGFGLLPAGNYIIRGAGAASDPITVGSGNWRDDDVMLHALAPAALDVHLLGIDSSMPSVPIGQQFLISSAARISWASMHGRYYMIEYTEDLGDPASWKPLTTSPVQAVGAIMNYWDENPTGSFRAYRVKLLP